MEIYRSQICLQKFQVAHEHPAASNSERASSKTISPISQGLSSTSAGPPPFHSLCHDHDSHPRVPATFPEGRQNAAAQHVPFPARRTCFFSKLWFYNMFTPSGGDYLIKLNETVLSAMNSQVWEMSFLEGYFEEIEWLVGVEKKKLKASNYFDLLLYS